MQPEMRGTAVPPSRHQVPAGKKRRLSWITRELRYSVFVVTVGCALILAALAVFFWSSPSHTESDLINANEYQAVFLTNGQVYFGKITKLNNNYMVLTDIFYLQSNSSSNNPQNGKNASNNLTLVKLGVNELHAPEDQMVINQPQISFWENIKDSSKVVQAIDKYNANPTSGNASSTTTTGQ